MNFFKFRNKNKIPQLGELYAVNTGLFAGHFFIFVEKQSKGYGFLVVPEMKNETVPVDQFDIGVNEGIIEYVERVPKVVTKTVRAKFKENKGKLYST